VSEDFDHIATSYDDTFTNTKIGQYQRERVYQFLLNDYPTLKNKNILEINGGTGADALWLANKNAHVTFTDISPKMVAYAKQKFNLNKQEITSHVLDVNQVSSYYPTPQFDLVFSNFGGLNCLTKSELRTFFKSINKSLNENGALVLVIMPSFCLLETLYFLSKFKFKKAFRRSNKKGVQAHVDGEQVKTYYYSPKTIENLALKYFELNQVKPVGVYVPPSYLEPFFSKRPNWLNKLWKKEKRIKNFRRLSFLSDHYYIRLSKK